MDALPRLFCASFCLLLAISQAFAEQSPPRPLVLVPGILGTKLCTSSGEVVWGNARSLWNFQRLHLDEGDQLRKCGLVEGIQILGPLFTMKAYGPLLYSLSDIGYTVDRNLFIFDYDWRRSNYDSAVLFKQFIDENKRTGRLSGAFDVIAHSMGGIVTRIYLDIEPSHTVNKVIFLATPFLGSANTLGLLSEGWGSIENWMAGGKERIRDIVLSFPALLELLPRYQDCCYLRNADQTKTNIDIFSVDTWKTLGWLPARLANDPQRFARFKTQIERAGALSPLLRTPFSYEVKFAGDSHPTLTFLGMYSQSTTPSPRNWFFSKQVGDGTVPAWSAARNPAMNSLSGSLVSFSEHATIFDDDWVASEIRRELLSIVPIHREPIAGTGHPVISSIVDGVQRNWTIGSIEFLPLQTYLTLGEKIQATATIEFEGSIQGLRPGFIAPKVIAEQAGTTKDVSMQDATTMSDVAQSRLIYKLDIPSTDFGEGVAEFTLLIPNTRNDARATAQFVLKNP